MTGTNMQPGTRRQYYARSIRHYTKRNYAVMALGALFVLGIVLGTLLVRSADSDTLEILLKLLGDHTEHRMDQTFTDSLLTALTVPTGILLAVFLCGMCALGQPAGIAVPFLRGLGFGFSVATLYSRYGTQALGFVGVLMLPGMLLSTMALLYCCREALRMSSGLWKALNGMEGGTYSLQIYCARFIAAGVLCGLAAFLESVLYAFLGNVLIPV